MIRFSKAHAYGNDFLYVEASQLSGVDVAALARAMCDRHCGIGADGLIVYEPAAEGMTMRLYNADGGRAEVSGNGLRGLAALILDAGKDRSITIRTEAGAKQLTRIGQSAGRQTFRAAMGVPAGLQQMTLSSGDELVQAVVMNIGNPQCVVLGPLPSIDRFQHLGASLERHEAFPEGTNVEFASVEALDRVRILIWERGVGPTRSSGTGSCAALVAAAAYGGAAREADVIAPGGSQRVEWQDDGIYLTGWAELVCRGEWLGVVPPQP
jgi:diaminopimelate epimerase